MHLIEAGWGPLYRAYRTAGAVSAGRSDNNGVSWADVAVAADADAATEAGPWLVELPDAILHCWYHSVAGLRCWQSEDHGATWADVATHAGLTHPSACWLGWRYLVAAHDGTGLNVYKTDDWGVTLDFLATVDAFVLLPGVQITQHRVSLVRDRRNTARLYYGAPGLFGNDYLLLRYSTDGENWSSNTSAWIVNLRDPTEGARYLVNAHVGDIFAFCSGIPKVATAPNRIQVVVANDHHTTTLYATILYLTGGLLTDAAQDYCPTLVDRRGICYLMYRQTGGTIRVIWAQPNLPANSMRWADPV